MAGVHVNLLKSSLGGRPGAQAYPAHAPGNHMIALIAEGFDHFVGMCFDVHFIKDFFD
ncbi:MAG: hypothetical protein H0U54_12740, partial [Acidobacteria bacterium]|nr:hypothetical protein [Acidobacteriota bacterium]